MKNTIRSWLSIEHGVHGAHQHRCESTGIAMTSPPLQLKVLGPLFGPLVRPGGVMDDSNYNMRTS